MIPRLHVVTDDDVLADARFPATAAALARSLGPDLALHLRGHHTPAGRLHRLATDLEDAAEGTGAGLLLADRVDVALATRGAGVRLGALSIPVAVARSLVGARLLAASVHAVDEAVGAVAAGADFVVLGTIWPTASHPGRDGAGTALIRAVAARVDAPVVAIGGVTPARAAEALAAGAAGVAVVRGVWAADDPLAAAAAFVAAMGAVPATGGSPR
ncbi:MAG TPA: thiamine phosphate synthase [Longimicrobiales bacterium]|nr:thiamine phosphate synthase [Longimicrobiales bacterium]